jgi:hypothetical protein
MYHDIRTCRFCKEHGTGLLKYGTRAYAHPRCYIEHHALEGLKPWQVASLPFVLLQKHELLADAEGIVRREQERQRAAGYKMILGEEPL